MNIAGNLSLASGNRVSYIETGNADGLPVLFLHGNSFSKEVFSKQFADAELRKHRLLALDLPGHGNSAFAKDPKNTYSFEGFAGAVIDFLKVKNIERCVVAGWSLGGQVALELINRSERIAGVFAFGAPPAPNGTLGLVRSMRFCRMLLLATKPQFTREDALYFEKAALGEYAIGKFVETLLDADPDMRPAISRNLLISRGMSQRDRFERSSIPVCLLHGRNDGLVRTPYMEALTSPMLAGGKTIVLDNAGHAPFLEQEEIFNYLLNQFCNSIAEGSEVVTPVDEWQFARAA